MNRILKYLLLTVLLLGALSATAGAEELSGTFGDDNLTWALNEETGTLTVSGNGAMPLGSASSLPWNNVGARESIRHAVFEEGITNLPYQTFYYCPNVETVSLPSTFTELYEEPFYDCEKLRTITVSPENPKYAVLDGMLMSKDGKHLLICPGAREGSLTIPESVEMIARYAFKECQNLTEVTIGEHVSIVDYRAFAEAKGLKKVTIRGEKVIGRYAFGLCSGLEEVDFGSGALTIGEGAFNACSALKSVVIPAGSTVSGSFTFHACSSLVSADLSALTVETLPGEMFSGCSSLTDLYLPKTLTSIPYSFIYQCNSLTTLTLPATLTRVTRYGIYGCGVKEVIFEGSPRQWENITMETGNDLLKNAALTCLKEDNDASDDVFVWAAQADGTMMLVSCTSQDENLIIPAVAEGNVVTAIGPAALSGAANVTHVTLPGTLRRIDKDVFGGDQRYVSFDGDWANLTALSIAEGNELLTTPHVTRNVGGLYDGYNAQWAEPGKSFLYAEDNHYIRVEYTGEAVAVELYDEDFEHCFTSLVDAELPIWGGFYAGEEYNFLVFGQENLDQMDSLEVIRVVRYTKSWQRVDQASIYGANTTIPFDAGGMSITEKEGLLFLRTSHEMYTASDGLNHQANLNIIIEVADEYMSLYDIQDYVWNPDSGYVSHSFNQHILVDSSNYVIALDHGDASPRGAYLFKYYDPLGALKFHHAGTGIMLAEFPDYEGMHYNYTGAYVSGLAETSSGYVSLYSSRHEGSGMKTYLAFTPKDNFSESATVTRTVAVSGGEARLVPAGMDGGYIFWEDQTTACLHYAVYSADGSVSAPVTADGRLSDCPPIFHDGKVIWYVTDGSAPTFYVLENGQISSSSKDDPFTVTFTVEDGYIRLNWPEQNISYNDIAVYAATESSPWVFITDGDVTSTGATILDIILDPGVYTRFRVDYLTREAVTASRTAQNASLTVTKTAASGASVALIQTESYTGELQISGLKPNVMAALKVIAENRTADIRFSVDYAGKAEVTFIPELFNSTFTLAQPQDVTANGETASFTCLTYVDAQPTPPPQDPPKLCTVTVTTNRDDVTLDFSGAYNYISSASRPAVYYDVAEGTYDLTLTAHGCLTYTLKGITVAGEDLVLGPFDLVPCDVNGDDMINIMDMGVFRANFGAVGSAIRNPLADVNGDSMVNIMDMGVFRANFGKTAAKDCTFTYSPA